MRVDFTGWHVRPGLVARIYHYSQMGNARDMEMEVHFDIHAGYIVYTSVSFLLSDLDLPQEIALRVSLAPVDSSSPEIQMPAMGKPDGKGGAVIGMFGQDDQRRCLGLFLKGKQMHFRVETAEGELLARLPLPNDAEFQGIFSAAHDDVRNAE